MTSPRSDRDSTTRQPLLGGVFALDLPFRVPQRSILSFWGATASNSMFFRNARSALAEILKLENAGRVWLPAYTCADLVRGCVGIEHHYYPVGSTLVADADWLSEKVKLGDAVVTIDYFGRNQPEAITRLAANRSDVLWIQDCAQAFDPGVEWADWKLFSPRKLLGVPDGGVAVSRRGAIAARVSQGSHTLRHHQPTLARFEDSANTANEWWYPLFQTSERQMTVSDAPMSRLSENILEAIESSPLMDMRRRNHSVLADRLGDLAYLRDLDAISAPFGFPIRLSNCETVWRKLMSQSIFAPRHWLNIPSPPSAFPEEHRLSAELITLPCDQRYDESDMAYLADRVLEAVR
jgi:hypothetical protein